MSLLPQINIQKIVDSTISSVRESLGRDLNQVETSFCTAASQAIANNVLPPLLQGVDNLETKVSSDVSGLEERLIAGIADRIVPAVKTAIAQLLDEYQISQSFQIRADKKQ